MQRRKANPMNRFISYSKKSTAIDKARRASVFLGKPAKVYKIGRKLYAVTTSPLPMAAALVATAVDGRVKFRGPACT